MIGENALGYTPLRYGDVSKECPYCGKDVDAGHYRKHFKCKCGEKIYYNGWIGFTKTAGGFEIKNK